MALGLLDDHLRHGVAASAAEGGQTAGIKLTEAAAAIERLVKQGMG